MKSSFGGDPQAIPASEVSTCRSVRRNHDVLLGPRAEMLFHMLYVGHYICREEFHIKRRMGASALVLLSLAGEGELSYQGGVYRMKKGSCALIDTRIEHEYYPLGDGWSFKFLHFWGGMSRELLTDMEARGPVRDLDGDELVRAEALLDSILAETEAESIGDYPHLSGEIYSLLMLFLSHDEKKADRASAGIRAIPEIIAFIRNNYHRRITTEEIADSVGLSRSYLSELFQKMIGMPPHEYVTEYRLSAAKTLLTGTALTVTEIAERTGFRDIFAFSRRFKKKNGISPQEYRRQNMIRQPDLPPERKTERGDSETAQ